MRFSLFHGGLYIEIRYTYCVTKGQHSRTPTSYIGVRLCYPLVTQYVYRISMYSPPCIQRPSRCHDCVYCWPAEVVKCRRKRRRVWAVVSPVWQSLTRVTVTGCRSDGLCLLHQLRHSLWATGVSYCNVSHGIVLKLKQIFRCLQRPYNLNCRWRR